MQALRATWRRMRPGRSEAQSRQGSLPVLPGGPQAVRGCAPLLLLFRRRRGVRRPAQEGQRPRHAGESGELWGLRCLPMRVAVSDVKKQKGMCDVQVKL